MATGYYKTSSLILFCVLISFATNAQRTIAAPKIGDLDEYLQKRAQESYDESLKAYNPDPEALTDDFIGEVDEILTKEHNNNSTRRLLGENRCRSMNPIDRCWRCDPKWAKNRKKLAECARGFGYRTTGGAKGRYYVVTDPSDRDVANPKPGTLRHAVIQKKPLWIIFAHSMVISLKQELIMTSDKTIDGRGVQVHIAYGAGLTIQFVRNVIVHNVWIHNIVPTSGGMIRDSVDHIGYRTMSDGDGITVFGSNNVWIDHVSLAKGTDGLIDVVEGSTAITISNCKFNNHNDVMLLGANDGTSKDAIMQVTIAFNLFGHGLVQRMPRCRWGFFHVVNNDYSHWELYAIGGSAHPTIISQGNRFRASNYRYTKEVTKRDYASPSEWKKWQWRSEGDRFQNGAFFVQSGPAFRHKKNDLLSGNNGIKYLPGSFVGPLTRDAGAMRCSERTYC